MNLLRPLVAVWVAALAPDVVGAQPMTTPDIRLSPAREGEWRVEFVLPRASDALRFVRNPRDWRTASWRPEGGFELQHTSDGDVLRRKDGSFFERAALDVAARYTLLPKDYAPFSPFTDGGLLIHTGQFHACAASGCGDDPRWTIRVEASETLHLIVGGATVEGPVTFEDEGDGTNIYAGKSHPVGSDRFIAVIDEGLPPDVYARLRLALPAFMDAYARRLGALPGGPMLFVSLDPEDESSGSASQGGTLPGQIFIHLFGEGWRRPGAKAPDGWLEWFFAHEAAHLFQMNGVDQSAIPADSAWIHEGGAEAMAAIELERLGGAYAPYVEGRKASGVAACARGLTDLGGALNRSAQGGAFQNYYACGLLAHLAIDSEMRSTGAGDLFDVWSLFLSRVRDGAAWSQSGFIQAAHDAGAPKAAQFAEALASTAHDDPDAFLRQSLLETGLNVAD